MIDILTLILAMWLIIATTVLYIFNSILKNHETLLYLLRDEINQTKRETGHIFVKGVDKDFSCPKITKEALKDD